MTEKNSYFKATNRVVSAPELLNRAHRVRTATGKNYINHLDGWFYTSSGDARLSLSQIYPITVAAFSTNRRVIAKRKGVNRPLLAGIIVKKQR